MEVKPTYFRAENGLTVIVKENHSTPIVALSVYLYGGVRAENEKNSGISHLTQRLLLKGTRNRTAEETAEELEFIGASLQPFTGKDSMGLSMSIISRHLERGLSILSDCVLNPLFLRDEIEKERKNILIEIAQRKDEPLIYCQELCEEALFSKHPYRLPLKGRESSIHRLKDEELSAWHRKFYTPGHMVVSLAGDVRAKEATRKLLKCLEGLPESVEPPSPPSGEPSTYKKRHITKEREKRQVTMVLGFKAPPITSPEYFAFDVLNHVLSGMGARLFLELRDRQGLAYAVNSIYEGRLDCGVFKAFIGTSSEMTDHAREAMLCELEKIKEAEVPDDELERAKRYMLGLNEISLQRNAIQAAQISYYEFTGLGHDMLEKYPRLIRKVTAAEVLQAARAYLDTKNYALAIIRPKE
ncbi:MAG: pitrilysin family protein [bacterium]